MSEKKNDKEIRLANISDFSIEHRKDEDGGKMIIEGYAAVYDDETLIGDEEWGFYESIERGAFDGANMKDVPLKYNHSDAVPILARTRNKSLELKTDDKGLFIHAELLDTQDNIDMYKRIKAGLIDKMSFAFTVRKEGETWEKGKTPKRSIKKFDRIFDVSVVDVPAYEGTSIYARSLEFAEAFKGTVETESSEKRNYAITNLIKQYKGV
jgi:HK97 family phage prohead protease